MPPYFSRAATTALLVCTTVARAEQPQDIRLRREQQLVLARVTAGSEPELRVARGIPTVMRFDAEVVHAEVKEEGLVRLVWLDVLGPTLMIEPRRDLGAGKRLPLEVVLVKGSTRTRLIFQLVSHPSEVDLQVDVKLHPDSDRPAPEPEVAAPRREDGPFSRLVFSGAMRESGVTTSMFRGNVVGSGVGAARPWDYRAEHGRAIAFHVHNPTGAKPWLASEVVCLSPSGEVLADGGRWVVSMVAPIEPGGSGLVVVESLEDVGDPVRLEVREQGGSRSVRVEETR